MGVSNGLFKKYKIKILDEKFYALKWKKGRKKILITGMREITFLRGARKFEGAKI